MSVILASNSPRRRQLLTAVTQDFIVIPATGEEVVPQGMAPASVAVTLATAKCREVSARYPLDTVIGCDTIVVFEGKILGKPHSPEEAIATLTALSGKRHEVITGVCIRSPKGEIARYDRTLVQFETLSASQIEAYVATGSPMDKAGSYGIQDGGLVASIEGSYENVVGLPVALVKEMLQSKEVVI